MNEQVFVSWSGGKDCMLALMKATMVFKPKVLLTMLIENGYRSRSHGLRREIMEAQALSLGLPIRFHATSWSDYEKSYERALVELKEQGLVGGIFGDIKIDGDEKSTRSFADNICAQAGMHAYEPLWELTKDELCRTFVNSGIEAMIVAVSHRHLDKKYLGRLLNKELLDDFARQGIHPFGERGEYHTLVIDCQLFSKPLSIRQGSVILRSDFWFLDVRP